MPQYFEDWTQALAASLQDLWFRFVQFIPDLVGSLAILIIGLIIAWALSALTKRLVRLARIDDLLSRFGVKKNLARYGIQLDVAALLGWFARWFVIIGTLIAVADALRVPQISEFLSAIALYIPNVIAAVVILGIGIIAAASLREWITRAAQASPGRIESPGLLGAVAHWAVAVFALLAALAQLGIARELIQILLFGLVAMIALAGGISFGLAGRDFAHRALERITTQTGRRQ